MKIIRTGMFWVDKKDIPVEVINRIRTSYVYPHPHEDKKVFPTFIELSTRIGIPAGDIGKAENLVDLSLHTDQTVVESVEHDISLTGLTLRPYQEEALSEALDYFWTQGQTSFNLSGDPGCVDKDTEFLTPDGWKRIADYDNDLVMQVSTDLKASYTIPEAFINKPADGWYDFVKGNTSMRVSGEHTVVYKTSKGNLHKKSAEALYNDRTHIKLYSNIRLVDQCPVELSDAEIRLIVAVAADGSLETKSTNLFRVNLKKQHKINRFRTLLIAANVTYIEKEHNTGYTTFRFKHISSKPLKQLWGSTEEQLKVVYTEFHLWDGYIDKRTGCKQFSTTNKEDADFIQYVLCTTTDRVPTIDVYDRRGETYETGGKTYIRKSIEYTVRETTTEHKHMDPKRDKDRRATYTYVPATVGERKFCFTVPTGMFLARKGNFVFITGNSGKSVMVSAIIAKIGVKTLIIAHLSMLTTQLKQEIEQFTDADVKVLDADNLELGDVNIATSQFISNRPELWYQIKKHIGLIVVDEAESIASETTLRILQRAHARYRIAITATFTRSVDGRTPALTDMIGHKVITLVNKDLLKPTIISVQCDEYFSKPRNKNLYKKALVNFFRTNSSITQKVVDITVASLKKGRQVLIASDLKEFQEEYAEELEELGYKVGVMNGSTKKERRNEILSLYNDGKIDVLVGFGVLNAGLSIPRISTIIRVSTPGNLEKLEQLIGRGRRDFDGKEGLWFIDLMFTGFRYANESRRIFYRRMVREKDWKFSSIPWDKFKEKL